MARRVSAVPPRFENLRRTRHFEQNLQAPPTRPATSDEGQLQPGLQVRPPFLEFDDRMGTQWALPARHLRQKALRPIVMNPLPTRPQKISTQLPIAGRSRFRRLRGDPERLSVR